MDRKKFHIELRKDTKMQNNRQQAQMIHRLHSFWLNLMVELWYEWTTILIFLSISLKPRSEYHSLKLIFAFVSSYTIYYQMLLGLAFFSYIKGIHPTICINLLPICRESSSIGSLTKSSTAVSVQHSLILRNEDTKSPQDAYLDVGHRWKIHQYIFDEHMHV